MGRLMLVAALAAVVTACGGSDDGPLPDLSGIAWLGGDRYLVVHDAKNPAEKDRGRLTIMRLPQSLEGVERMQVDLEWPEPQGESNDLESADRIPGTNRVLLAESGDDGGAFRRLFLVEYEDGDGIELVSFAQWPEPVENVEGIAVARVGGRLVFLYAERAQGEASTQIAWAELRIDPLGFGSFRRVRYTTPERHTAATRPVSALAVDSAGRIYVGSAFDADVGDDGPYKSSVWRVGRVVPRDGSPEVVLAEEPELLGRLTGLKVECVVVVPGGGGARVLVGTDDENYGGVLRPLTATP